MLFVTPAGSKLWRLRYAIRGKEKLLSLGPYPSVGLAKAREEREAAKALLRAGKDPGLEKKLRRAAGGDTANSFEATARDWHGRNLPTWTERHGKDVLDSLETDVFSTLGQLPIKEITAPMVLGVLRAIEARPALETARRVRQRMSAIFVYAIALGAAVLPCFRRGQGFSRASYPSDTKMSAPIAGGCVNSVAPSLFLAVLGVA